MNELIFDIQRFANYVVTANGNTGAVSVKKDGKSTGISASINDNGGIYLTDSVTLSSGDSLTLSKTPETAEIAAAFNLDGAGSYTINGFKFTSKSESVLTAWADFDNTGNRYIYPGFGIEVDEVGVIYNGVTYKKNSSTSGDGFFNADNHGGKDRIWLTNIEAVNVTSGTIVRIEPEQMNGSKKAGQLKINGITVNYDAGAGNYKVKVTNSGLILGTEDNKKLYTLSYSSNYNTLTLNSSSNRVTASYVENVLTATDDVYDYTGGNASISSFESGQTVNLEAKYKGFSIGDTDFKLKSANGAVTVQNARNKVINVTSNDKTIANVYLAKGSGTVDGSEYSKTSILVGGKNANNYIIAGSGGGSLWGSAGGNDTLVGGSGSDKFIYGKKGGSDIINNTSSRDTVNLYNLKTGDLISRKVSGNEISLTFSGGGTLKVNATDNLSPTFQFSGGGSYRYNQSTGKWQKS